MKKNTWPILFVGLLVVALSAGGCYRGRGIASGGGTIPGANSDTEVKGATKANFGFWGDSCGTETVGNFNYHDKSVSDEGGPISLDNKRGGGLKIIGRVDKVCDCTTPLIIGGDSDCLEWGGLIPHVTGGLCADCFDRTFPDVVACLDEAENDDEREACLGSASPMAAIKGDYYSTNPKYEDEGDVYACVVDNGEGSNALPDKLYIWLESEDTGPYDGYQNSGDVSGNIQTYPCLD
jgi:hypothetical protein